MSTSSVRAGRAPVTLRVPFAASSVSIARQKLKTWLVDAGVRRDAIDDARGDLRAGRQLRPARPGAARRRHRRELAHDRQGPADLGHRRRLRHSPPQGQRPRPRSRAVAWPSWRRSRRAGGPTAPGRSPPSTRCWPSDADAVRALAVRLGRVCPWARSRASRTVGRPPPQVRWALVSRAPVVPAAATRRATAAPTGRPRRTSPARSPGCRRV